MWCFSTVLSPVYHSWLLLTSHNIFVFYEQLLQAVMCYVNDISVGDLLHFQTEKYFYNLSHKSTSAASKPFMREQSVTNRVVFGFFFFYYAGKLVLMMKVMYFALFLKILSYFHD